MAKLTIQSVSNGVNSLKVNYQRNPPPPLIISPVIAGAVHQLSGKISSIHVNGDPNKSMTPDSPGRVQVKWKYPAGVPDAISIVAMEDGDR